MDARRAAFRRGLSLAGELDRVPRPLLDYVRPKRFTSHDDLHLQRLGGMLAQKLSVPLNICVLMAHRTPCPGVGEADRDVLPCHRIAGCVHHEHVDRARTPAFVEVLVFGRLRSPVRATG